MRISHSQVELYNTCAYKWFLYYREGYRADKTFTPLLFGQSIDATLNYILIRKKRKHIIHRSTAKSIFQKYMNQWSGQNELVFFKNEFPEDQYIEDDPDGNQMRCWQYLCEVGNLMIDTYIDEILDLFEEILSVQTKRKIPNEEGDILVLIVDFRAKLKDGRIVTIDNKTTSNIKRNYPMTSVSKSNQLSIYVEYENNNTAAYLILQKRIENGKIVWKLIVDEIPEVQIEKAFSNIDTVLNGIKREEFPKNEKNCFMYGKPCIFWNACKKNNFKDLIKK